MAKLDHKITKKFVNFSGIVIGDTITDTEKGIKSAEVSEITRHQSRKELSYTFHILVDSFMAGVKEGKNIKYVLETYK